MRKTILLLIMIIPMGISLNAQTSPTCERVKPVNTNAETITIVTGASVTFSILGNDIDGNMTGIEWYNNSYLGTDSIGQASSNTFSRTISFTTVGSYIVSGVVFDSDSSYGNTVSWTVNVVEQGRKMYVDNCNQIVGVPNAENQLLSYAQQNGITELYAYWLNRVFWGGNTEYYSLVDDFIGKAKNSYGIERVVVPVGGVGEFTTYMGYYNDAATVNKFDGAITEIEFWGNTEGTTERTEAFDDFKDVLTELRTQSDNNGGNISVEVYLGWTTEDEMADIVDMVDLIGIHSYTSNLSGLYNYNSDRLQDALNSSNAANVEIVPIFSFEDNFSGAYTMDQLDESWFDDYNDDDDLDNKYMANVSGALYFTYMQMDDDLIRAPVQTAFNIVDSDDDSITIQAGNSVELETTIEDYNGDVGGVEWYVDGVYYSSSQTSASNSYTFSETFTFSDSGSYEIIARPFDLAGNYTPDYRIFDSKTIEVVSYTVTNLALNETVSQSSTSWNGVASRAVDGNTDGAWSGGSVSHTDATETTTQDWWEVDLNELSSYISYINIYNRTDACCSARLTDFHVFVSDDPFTSTTVSGTQAQSGVSDFYITGEAGSPTEITIGTSGQYVRVQLESYNNPLSLAEVQVFGISSGLNRLSENKDEVELLVESQYDEIVLYPNPTVDFLNITLPESAQLKVFSISGRYMNVLMYRDVNKTKVDVSSLSNGIYFVQIVMENKEEQVLKFIKK